MSSAQVVVCGAGIAGVSIAFHLKRLGVDDVVVVDPRPPLTLTSDKSTECYRNWWPNQPMVDLMSLSIDLMEQYAEESDNIFGLNRRGYLFVTADTARLDQMRVEAEATSSLGAGGVRDARGGLDDSIDGVDFYPTGDSVMERFPFITDRAVGGIHIRRAGWLSAQQLGAWMIENARVEVIADEVVSVSYDLDGVSEVGLRSGTSIKTRSFVNAAGPMLDTVGRMVGLDLPVASEVHVKLAFRDSLQVIPRDAPMFIWNDPQIIDWSNDEREGLIEEGRSDLLRELPIFCHGRPEGEGDWVLALWEYSKKTIEPVWPIPEDPLYPEVVMRGLSTMAPAFTGYLDHLPEPVIDGGYYTKTQENRPLVGPIGPEGSFVCGALSGFGVMAACGVGELTALHIVGLELPNYAPAFQPDRYDDPAYRASLASAKSGQL